MVTSINNVNNYFANNVQPNSTAQKVTNSVSRSSPFDILNDPKVQMHSKIGAIQERLRMGKELSADEMNYLRENAPEWYGKAVQISNERRLLSDKLKNCKTKEEARALRLSSVSALVGSTTGDRSQATVLDQNDFNLMRMRAVEDVFDRFEESRLFEGMPVSDYTKIGKSVKHTPFEIPKAEESAASMVVSKLRAQRIAMKIARGETITSEEKSFINEKEPGLVSEAERAVHRRKKLALEMRYKTTNNEKKQFLKQARNDVIGFESTSGSAELMLGAIDKLESEM